jgi:hypothetical protein
MVAMVAMAYVLSIHQDLETEKNRNLRNKEIDKNY